MSVLGVHGFNTDAVAAAKLYDDWSRFLGGATIDGFVWNSGLLTVDGELRALRDGEPDPYEDAYQRLSPAASVELAKKVGAKDRPACICHSLGSRTALLSIIQGAAYSRMVVFNGAMLRRDVPPFMHLIPTLNLVCRSDLVLTELGSKFGGEHGECIGSAGLPGAVNIVVDDPAAQQLALDRRGWAIQGSDHWNVYGWRGNWPMVRAFLAGDDLADLAGHDIQRAA